MGIDKLSAITRVYPAKKLEKVIRDEPRSGKEQASQDENKEHKKKNDSFNEDASLHIDEMV
jgi:hypothetical protein